jgi:hypothetical protein
MLSMAFNVANNTTSCQCFSLVCSLDAVALSLILRQRLFFTLSETEKSFRLEHYSSQNALYRLKHKPRLVYRSSLAFRLQKQSDLPPMELALYFFSLLSCNILEGKQENKPTIEIGVTVIEPGWLDFSVAHGNLAPWLDYLPLALQLKTDSASFSSQAVRKTKGFNPFPLQYAHARCCSLLRSAAEQSLIKLKSDDFTHPQWQWLEPARIPWLDENQQWQLGSLEERNLLYQLIDTMDLLFNNSSEDWEQITRNLSKALLEVEAHSRIFGEVQRKNPQVAQARLGLIGLTQLLLNRLLTDKLGVLAVGNL